MLALGANIVAPNLAKIMADTFISTDFLDGFSGTDRDFFIKGVEELEEIEKKAYKKYYAS